MSLKVSRILAGAAALGLLFACSKEVEVEKPGADLLQFVPADTDYVFVNVKQLPDKLRGRLADFNAAQLSVQRKAVANLRDQMAQDEHASEFVSEGAQVFAVLDALLAEFEGRDTAAKVRELGIEPATRAVFFGVDMLPVLRMEIADAALLNQTLDRVERNAGVSAQRGELNGQSYRRIDAGPVEIVLAIADRHLVAGVMLDERFDSDLPLVLGQQKPAKSLAEQDTLSEMTQRHGFTGYGEGYVRLDHLVAGLLDRLQAAQAGGDAAGAQQIAAPPLSSGCRQLITEMVAGMPRMVVGVTQADDASLATRSVWEATPGVAGHLQKVAAPVPGVGARYEGLLAVGMGLNLPEVRNAVEVLLRNVMESGGQCEWVEPEKIQSVIPNLNLALGPMTAGIRGFNLVLDDVVVDEATMQPLDVRGGLLAAVDDPRGIFALGAMFNPALASLQVPDDGSFVDLQDALGAVGETPPAKVAIRDKSLLLVVGEETEKVAATLTGAAPITPAPWLAIDYGLRQLIERVGGVMTSVADNMESQGDPDTAMQIREQLTNLQQQSSLFERMHVSMYASDKGLVIDQQMTLRN